MRFRSLILAATALLARVGNENVNLTMASLGLSSTEIRWSPDSGDIPPLDEEPIIDDAEEPTEEPTVEDEPSDAGELESTNGSLRNRRRRRLRGRVAVED